MAANFDKTDFSWSDSLSINFLWRKYQGLIFACLIAFLLCSIPGACAAEEQHQTKKVLVVPSYNFDYLGSKWFLQGVMEGFRESSQYKVVYFHENLQLAAHSLNEQYYNDMAESLKIKYSQEKPDLVIAQYKQATEP